MEQAEKTLIKAHKHPRDPDNFYTEPKWCSERLLAEEGFEGSIADPCAGSGNIPAAASNAGFNDVRAYDWRDRGVTGVVPNRNFWAQWEPGHWPVDNIVSNPPYGQLPKLQKRRLGFERLEDYFVHLALKRTTKKVAVFLPSVWINAEERSRWLEGLPLARVYKCAPRPSCPPGKLVMRGMKAEGGKVDFSWYVFEHGHTGPWTGHWLRRDD